MPTTLTHTIQINCASEVEAKEIQGILNQYEFTPQGLKFIHEKYNDKGLIGPQIRKLVKQTTKKWL